MFSPPLACMRRGTPSICFQAPHPRSECLSGDVANYNQEPCRGGKIFNGRREGRGEERRGEDRMSEVRTQEERGGGTEVEREERRGGTRRTMKLDMESDRGENNEKKS
eukprot:619950-Hanusia_phi.AAC.3